MKKTTTKKLSLTKQTIKTLDATALGHVAGGKTSWGTTCAFTGCACPSGGIA